MMRHNAAQHVLWGNGAAWRGWCLGALLATLVASGAADAPHKHVLLLHSYGRGFEPFNTFSETFRTELAQQLGEPVEFSDVPLEGARFESQASEGSLVNYLSALFAGQQLDLVVPIGGPAVRFGQRYRQQLFPTAPMLFACTDERHLQRAVLTTNDAVVAVANDPVQAVEHILQVLPQTTNVAVVIGNSPLEQFWLGEVRRAFQPFTNRVNFIWLDQLSFAEMRRRVAGFPPRTAIFYALFSVDVQGVPYTEERALAELHAVANAPMFGLHDSQMGRGIVGGPLMAIEDLGRNTAKVAVRVLHGELAGSIQTPIQIPGKYVYDWRELQRWNISEARLAAGSVMRFREPTFWERQGWRIIANIVLVVVEIGLVALLVASLARQRRANKAIRNLSGRLIHAQEEERARLARDLHDDVTQRLARLAIDAGRIEREAPASGVGDAMRGVREGLVQLSEDVHALSYRLHPSILEDLGLVEALRAECERSTGQGFGLVDFKCSGVLERVPKDAALCMFRVAQESLRNAARHAMARSVEVTLRRMNDGLQLAIHDDGVGFDLARQHQRPSLGLAGMNERVRLLGGELEIDTAPGHGTTVVAWVPLKGNPLENSPPRPSVLAGDGGTRRGSATVPGTTGVTR